MGREIQIKRWEENEREEREKGREIQTHREEKYRERERERERETETETAIPFLCNHLVEYEISIPARGLTKAWTVHDVGE